MRTVRCVSPHGGAHHGLRADNELPAAPGYQGALMLPPNDGGWVYNAVLGHVAVGGEVDAPEPPEFIADGFHFVDVTTGTGDVCSAGGDACWCGQHREADLVPPPAETPSGEVARQEVTQVTPGGSLADLLKKGDS
jgi:hypothetical protein